MLRVTNSEISCVLEDLGAQQATSIEFDLPFDFLPEEPMVRYYPDGSGHPGSPAEINFGEPKASAVVVDGKRYCRTDHEDWFEFIDGKIDEYVQKHVDIYEEQAAEEMAAAHEEYDDAPEYTYAANFMEPHPSGDTD